MRDIALALIFAVLISFAFKRAWMGLLIWSWFSYMNPHRYVYSWGYNFQWVLITAAVTVFVWLGSKERKTFPLTLGTCLEIVLCFWMTFTTFFAFADTAWDYWNRAIKVQIMIFMTLFIMRSRFRLNALVFTIAISLGFIGVKGGIWAFLTGGTSQVIGPAQSFISDNNTCALALVMVLPLIRYLQLQSPWKFGRWAAAFAQVTISLAILSTYSRGGFIALCVVQMLLWMTSRHKIAFAIALLLVVPPLIKFMPQQWKDRMHTIETTDEDQLDDSAKGRLNSWGFALNLVQDRPITGGGFHVFISPAFVTYAPDAKNRHDAHSIYFEFLAEQGIPGLLMFLGMGFYTWYTARNIIRRTKKIPEFGWMRDMVSMVLVSLAGYATGGAFVGLGYFDLPYHLMAIVVLCECVLNDTMRSAAKRYEGNIELAAAEVEALAPV
jgi:probable O-glycosylation ligase (exosortase A-associated)